MTQPCADCDSPKSLGETIVRTSGLIANAHSGAAALYDLAVKVTTSEKDRIDFARKARFHRKLAALIARTILVPDDTPKQEGEI